MSQAILARSEHQAAVTANAWGNGGSEMMFPEILLAVTLISSSDVEVEGVCFKEQAGIEYSVATPADFTIVAIQGSGGKPIASVYIGYNPDVDNFDFVDSRYRTKLNNPQTIEIEDGEYLGVSNVEEQRVFHIFGGTEDGRRNASRLVSFCK